MRITGIRDVKAHFRATLSLVYNHKCETKRMKRAFGLILKHKEDVVIRKRPVFRCCCVKLKAHVVFGRSYLRILSVTQIVTCWLFHFHICFTEIKIYHLSFFHWTILFSYKEYKLNTTIRLWWNVPGTNLFSSRSSGVGRRQTLGTNLA